MAKKSFINADNPAMQFISAPAAPASNAAPAETGAVSDDPVAAPVVSEAANSAAPAANAPAAPVSSPSENGAPVLEAAPAAVQSHEDPYYIAPRSAEHKSKRAQLLMTPSLHEKVVRKAASLNMSFNELVNLLLEKYVQ